MSRLTEKETTGNGYKLVLKRHNGHMFDSNNQWLISESRDGEISVRGVAIDKLAKYEDLEEQNRIIRLPVAVGEIVYVLWNTETETIIRKMEVKEVHHGKFHFWNTEQYRLEDVSKRGATYKFYPDDFNKVFFSNREAAENALKARLGKNE